MTSYQPGIPTGFVNLDQDYQNIQNNFTQLDTTYKVDHVPLTQPTNNGFHLKASLVEQIVDPIPPVGVDTLYTKVFGSPMAGELFYVRGGAGTPIQMTSGDIFPYTNNYTPIRSPAVPPVGTAFSAGSTFLPGGFLMQYGTVDASKTTVIYPFLFSSAPFMIQLTLKGTQAGSSSRIALSVFSESNPSQFVYEITITSGVTANYVNWLAIGPA